jgi:outer membrane lipoprotein-sorting protein
LRRVYRRVRPRAEHTAADPRSPRQDGRHTGAAGDRARAGAQCRGCRTRRGAQRIFPLLVLARQGCVGKGDGRRVEGSFYIQKPGKVRFAYNPPSPIEIIADGSAVVVRDRSLDTQDFYPLSQTPLRYLLADHIDLLRDTDVVSVSADDTFLTVVIEETKLVVGTNRLMIMFDAKNLQLKQWTVTDPQGLDTTVAVYNVDSGRKPDPNLFVINYQPDPRSQMPHR